MQTVIGAMDAVARQAAGEASRHTLAAVRAQLPARSGATRAAQRPSVRRDGTGYTITVAPSARVRMRGGVSAREVTRFLEEGTGEFGPRGRPYGPRRAHAFRLPSGWHSGTVRGQPAHHAYARALAADQAPVEQIFTRAATVAAAAAERVLGGA